MPQLQPPLHLLATFVAVARFGSISRAAEALNLTQGAVSKRVQELEATLNVPLFERVRRRLALTPAGSRYEAAVRPLLAQLETATLDVIASADGGGALHLSALPTFSAKWLVPRVPRFARAHPNVALNFVPYVQGFDFSRPDLDCSILFGGGHWPDACAEYLTGRRMVVIAPPARRGLPPLRKPADVAGYALLHHVSVPDAWDRWCAAHGLRGVDRFAGPQLDQYQSMVRAVQVGMGLGLVPRCLVREEIAAGLVRELFPDDFEHDLGYWLCYPEAKARLPALAAFREWLRAECAAEHEARAD